MFNSLNDGENEKMVDYKCGHKSDIIICDSNLVTLSAWMRWNESVGAEGNKTQCWDCFCK